MEELLKNIRIKYPSIEIDAFENEFKVELQLIKVPEELRNRGIGTDVIKTLQQYAKLVNKPMVLRPEAERGKKKDLHRFYSNNGFIKNTGRNIDYSLSSPTASTMYWRFKEWMQDFVK